MLRTRSPSGSLQQQQQNYHHDIQISDEEEHGMMEEEEIIDEAEFIDEEDSGSSLSIPNESIDFDLVYAFHSFAATVEGQANVVKGDSLRLIDDSNSYWWLVNVLNTQDVGYIPAENIETPLERLARLNKHRNVDLTYPTQQEQQHDIRMTRERVRMAAGSRGGSNTPQRQRARVFVDDERTEVFNYPPAIWNEEEYDEDEDDELYYEDDENGDIHEREGINNSVEALTSPSGHTLMQSEDDEMEWEEGASEITVTVTDPASTEQESRASQQAKIGLGQPSLRSQTSRERLFAQQQAQAQLSPTGVQSSPMLDPAEATETRRITATPDLVRDHTRSTSLQRAMSPASNDNESQRLRSDSPKRSREEDSLIDEVAANKRSNTSKAKEPERQLARSASSDSRLSGSSSGHGSNKLRKEREKPSDDDKERKEEKKKKGGVLSSLFGRKNKDKDKGKGDSPGGIERPSEDSARSSSAHGHTSSTGGLSPEGVMSPMQRDAQGVFSTPPRQVMGSQDLGRNSTDPRRQQQQQPAPNVSPHTLKLQQADQQLQALYHSQHLVRGPGSQDNHVVPSYGLQSASEFLSSSTAANTSLKATPERQRPGSLLIVSPTSNDKQGHVPELTVIRVFAGDGMQTEATFKTVLLNGSTISQDLIKQAMQRFRLAGGENAEDYYLTIKQVDGPSAALKPDERPLLVFEGLVEAAKLPKLNRNSVGSISSLASNLSMHPAIQNLPMNDFTDDSAVKFYLNRRSSEEEEPQATQLRPQSVTRPPRSSSVVTSKPPLGAHGATIHPGSLTPERFSSPGVRFPLQVVIHPEDVPDGMLFDPQTEAIIPKSALRERPQSTGSVSGISLTKRRKILMFPKNSTVAEVIELGLERFGILEGVVDGGDDIEDKAVKRRSVTRVRYGLAIQVDGQPESILPPSSKVIEAFPRPPIFKDTDRRSIDGKRRSADSSSLLGVVEDVQHGDPVFVLRRGGNRLSNRHSVPLDDLALHRLHRDSTQSNGSGSIKGDETQGNANAKSDSPGPQHLSRQELIAAQRAASRANQRALLTANNNSERGVDLLLPDRAVIRSSHQHPGEKFRYSYVDPDGESFDISEIIEEESRADPDVDLVDGVLQHNSEKLDRILDKIKNTKKQDRQPPLASTGTSNSLSGLTASSSSHSAYSEDALRTPVDKPMGPPPRRVNSPTQPMMGERSRSPTQQVSAERAVSPSQRLYGARVMSPIQQVLGERAKSPPHTTIAERVMSPIQGQQQLAPTTARAKSPNQQPISAARARSPVQAGPVGERSSPVPVTSSRETTPVSRYGTPMENMAPSSRTTTPTQHSGRATQNRSTTPSSVTQKHQRQNSASSTQSEASQYAATPIDVKPLKTPKGPPAKSPLPAARIRMPSDIDFDKMWNIIEANALLQRKEKPDPPDLVEKMFFGPSLEVEKLHPEVQQVFRPIFDELERIDKTLDDMLLASLSNNLQDHAAKG